MKKISKFAIALFTVGALVAAGANPAMADSRSKKPKDKSTSQVVKNAKQKATTKKVAPKKKVATKKAKTAVKSKAVTKKSKATKPGLRKVAAEISATSPTIDSLSVESGAPGDEVTLTGSNLLDYATVAFGGVVAEIVYSADDVSITAVIPDGAVSGPITVTLNDGQTVDSADFTIVTPVDPYPTPTEEPTVDPTPTEEPTVDPTPTDEPTVDPSPTVNPWDVFFATVTQAKIDYSNAVTAAQDEFNAATADALAARDVALQSATTFNDVLNAFKTFRLATQVQKANLDAAVQDAQDAFNFVVQKARATLVATGMPILRGCAGDAADDDEGYGKPHHHKGDKVGRPAKNHGKDKLGRGERHHRDFVSSRR